MTGRVHSEDKTMTTIKTLIHKFNTRTLYLTLLSTVTAAAPLIAADAAATQEADQAHASHAEAAPAKLVQLVRDATKQFVNVNAATAAGYQPFLGCVSGPDHGAMGFHYVNGALVGDGVLDASHPEVLIYEASDGGLESCRIRRLDFLNRIFFVIGHLDFRHLLRHFPLCQTWAKINHAKQFIFQRATDAGRISASTLRFCAATFSERSGRGSPARKH